MKILQLKEKKGVVLIICLIALALLVFLSGYFLSFTLTGSKMVSAQEKGTLTYYLAEAGIAEALFKLYNDSEWKSAFETAPTLSDPNCASWSIEPLTRESVLLEGGSYTITVTNLGCAYGEIEVLAKITFSDDVLSKRTVKVKVFQARGSVLGDSTIFLGGPSENLSISFTDPLNVYEGSLFSNKAISVSYFSNVNVVGKALAGQNINIQTWSVLNGDKCSSNFCDGGCDVDNECPPDQKTMPPIDFDSGESGSYIFQAEQSDCSSLRTDGKTNCLFTPSEFEKVMWDNYPLLSLPLSAVVYISGDFKLRASQDLVINGVLAANRDISLGEDWCWTSPWFPFLRCGNSRLRVVKPGDGLPAGILAKRKLNTGAYLDIFGEGINVNGLIYSGDEMRFNSFLSSMTVKGAIAGRKVTFSSMWGGINFYLDEEVVSATFQNAQYSPIITIEHWEEEY